MEVYRQSVLTSALEGDVWPSPCSSHFTPREIVPGTHSTGSCLGPRATWDTLKTKKNLVPAENQTTIQVSSQQPSQYTEYTLPAPTQTVTQKLMQQCT